MTIWFTVDDGNMSFWMSVNNDDLLGWMMHNHNSFIAMNCILSTVGVNNMNSMSCGIVILDDMVIDVNVVMNVNVLKTIVVVLDNNCLLTWSVIDVMNNSLGRCSVMNNNMLGDWSVMNDNVFGDWSSDMMDNSCWFRCTFNLLITE